MGMMRGNKNSNREVYEHFVKYCASVGHTAPSFNFWMLLSGRSK
jgi:hypothetical protein